VLATCLVATGQKRCRVKHLGQGNTGPGAQARMIARTRERSSQGVGS
jgi:hypothetical protein